MADYSIAQDAARALVMAGSVGVSSKMIIAYMLKKIDEKQPKDVCQVHHKTLDKSLEKHEKRMDKIDMNIQKIDNNMNQIATDVAVIASKVG